jgi:hypothetical protein
LIALVSLSFCIQQGILPANAEDGSINPGDSKSDSTIEFKEKLKVANRLLVEKKYELAEEAFRKLLAGDRYGDAYAGLAIALARQDSSRKIVEAQKIVSKGKSEFTNNPNMVAAGGFVAFKHSKSVSSPAKRDLYLEASEKLCKRALSEDDSILIAWETLGSIYLMQNDPQGAIGPFRSLLDKQPNPENLVLLAQTLLKINPHSKEADSRLEVALRVDPSYAPARLQKSIYLLNNGTVEDAERQLHLIGKDQRGSLWNEIQGDIYKTRSDYRLAAEYWGLANRLDRLNPGPYLKLVRYYSRSGDYASVAAKFNDAIETLPNDINLRVQLMQIGMLIRPQIELELEKNLELERQLKLHEELRL